MWEDAEVVAESCLVCELVHDSTWTMLALSHWNLTSSITPTLSLNKAAKALWSYIPKSLRPQHHVWGWTTVNLCFNLHLWPCEIPQRGHYMIMADRAEPSSASGPRPLHDARVNELQRSVWKPNVLHTMLSDGQLYHTQHVSAAS